MYTVMAQYLILFVLLSAKHSCNAATLGVYLQFNLVRAFILQYVKTVGLLVLFDTSSTVSQPTSLNNVFDLNENYFT